MRHVALSLALLLGQASHSLAADVAALRGLADNGDPKAQYALGSMYRYGQGVPLDYAVAVSWWRKAADRGEIDAQFALGNLYAGGTGVPPNRVQAYMWFDIVASGPGRDWLTDIARANRDAVAGSMTSDDIVKAQQMAAAWRAKHAK